MSKVFTQQSDKFWQYENKTLSLLVVGDENCFKVTFWHDKYGRSSSSYITGHKATFSTLIKVTSVKGALLLTSKLCESYPE